jgi:TatD DNase family protein
MQLIDTHCHLDDSRFDHDREVVLAQAKLAGIEQLIVPATTRKSWRKIAQLVERDDSILPAYGLHPWFCDQHQERDLKQLAGVLEQAVAVGECGLDFGKERAPESVQVHWFRLQLELAAEKGLPVIVHAYKSLDRVLSELRSFPSLRGIVHSFSGSQQQAEALIKRGFYLGIGGAVTRTNASRLRNVVKQMPLEYLLLETDAPDQPGVAHRGARNEPAFLIEIAVEIATMRGMELSELIETCNHNARELFAI